MSSQITGKRRIKEKNTEQTQKILKLEDSHGSDSVSSLTYTECYLCKRLAVNLIMFAYHNPLPYINELVIDHTRKICTWECGVIMIRLECSSEIRDRVEQSFLTYSQRTVFVPDYIILEYKQLHFEFCEKIESYIESCRSFLPQRDREIAQYEDECAGFNNMQTNMVL